MALTELEKSSIRRHLRYGNIGIGTGMNGGGSLGANASWRYFGEWGDLEAAFDDIGPIDEASLTGRPFGLIVFQGLDPAVGNTLSLQFSGGGLGSPVTITTTAAGETRDQFALKVSGQIAQNAALNAARISTFAPSNGGRSGVALPLSQIEIVGVLPFLVTLVSQTGNIAANITANGSSQTDVYQTIHKVNVYGFLPICNALYALTGTANDRMGVDKADVFTARKSEYKERRQSWKQAVDDMADFLVVRVNPNPLNGNISNFGSL